MYDYIVSVTTKHGPVVTKGADTKEEAHRIVEELRIKFADFKVEAFSTRSFRVVA